MYGLLLALALTCGSVDDTTALQNAVNAGDVQLNGTCVVNGMTGVRIPSNRVVNAAGAVVQITPACADGRVCKIFETVPGAANVDIVGGEFRGTDGAGPGWQILIRLDAVIDASVQRVRFTHLRPNLSDAVYVGGNVPSQKVLLAHLEIDGAGRNGISVTNAKDVYVEHVLCTNGRVGVSPGACIDVEHNTGEQVERFTATDIEVHDYEVGIYVHRKETSPQGKDIVIIRSRIYGSRRYCMIMNSVVYGLIAGNLCEGGPQGISVGAQVEATRATEIMIWNNDVNTSRPIILAGVNHPKVVCNDLRGGRVETPVLGVVGNVTLEPKH